MKGLKRVLALVLTLCTMLGMLVIIDVQAVGTSDTQELKLVQAVRVPEYIATAAGIDSKAIMLTFNGDVTIDLNETDAVVTVVNSTNGNTSQISGYNNASGLAIWHVKLEKCNALGAYSYIATFEDSKVTWKNIEDAVTYMKGNNPLNTLTFRLLERKSTETGNVGGVNTRDGKVNGVTASGNRVLAGNEITAAYGHKWGNDSTKDAYDIPISDALTLNSAEWQDDITVKVAFSQAVTIRDDDYYSDIRLVNSKGQLMVYRPNETEKYSTAASGTSDYLQASVALTNGAKESTATITQRSSATIAEFDSGCVKSLSWFKAHLAACQAEHPDEEFSISYVVESKDWNASDNLNYYPARGEAANDWRIDGVYNAADSLPLMATKTGPDSAIVETTVKSGYKSVVVEKVNIIDDTTIEVVFSDAVKLDTSAFYGVRVIEKGRLKDGLQIWQKDGTSPQAQNAVDGYSNTWRFTLYTSLSNYALTNYFRNDVSKTLHLSFSIEDINASSPEGFIEAVKTKDGRRLLNIGYFATDTKERYYYPIEDDEYFYTSVKDVSITGENAVQIEFEDEVKLDTTGTFYGLRLLKDGKLYDGKGANQMWTAANDVKPANDSDSDGYASVWTLRVSDGITNNYGMSIREWISSQYIKTGLVNDESVSLCFAIQESGSNIKGNGFIECVTTKDSKVLLNEGPGAVYDTTTSENYGFEIEDKLFTSVEKVTFEGTNTLMVEFADAVKIDTTVTDLVGLRVLKDGALYNGDGHYQMWSTAVSAVSPDTDGYAKVWKVDVAFNPATTIKQWANTYYFSDACSEDYELCFTVSEKDVASNIKGNGLIEPVTTKDGKVLLNEGPGAVYNTSAMEHYGYPVKNMDYFYTDIDDVISSVEVVGDNTVLIKTKAAVTVSNGQKLYLYAFDNNNNVIDINGTEAKWEVALGTANGATSVSGTITEALGADSYSEISELLKNEIYELKLVTEDSVANNACVWLDGSVIKADISTTAGDIVSLPEIANNNKELVRIKNIIFVNDSTIQVEFNDKVNINTNGAFAGLRVINNGVLYSGMQTWQTVVTAVNGTEENGVTYADKWQIKVHLPILNFALSNYFRNGISKTADLSFVIEEAASKPIDGFIDVVTTADGRMLTNTSNYVQGRESIRIPVQENSYFYADVDIVKETELVGESNILFSTESLYGTGGLNLALRAYGPDGAILKNWPVSITRATGSAQKFTGTVQEAHGTNKYSEIVSLLDTEYGSDYELVLVAFDSNANGACEYLTMWNGKIAKASEKYSSVSEDAVPITLTDNGREVVSMTNVEIFSDDAQTGVKTVIVTFSHDIDIAHMLNSGGGMYLTTSAVGVNDFIDGNGDIGNAATGWAPSKQIILSNLKAYGNSKNMVIGEVDKASYEALVAEVERLNTEYSASNDMEYAIRFHIEIPSANSGQFDLNYNIKPLDSDVLSPVLNQAWGANSGRIWSNVKDGNDIKIGSAVITSENTVDVTFVDGMGNKVEAFKSENFDNYTVGVRITDEADELIYWNNTDENGNAIGAVNHTQFLGSMTKNEDAPYTWTVTLDGWNSDGVNLYDMFAAAKGNAEIGGTTEYKLYLAIEDTSNTTAVGHAKGYIDNFVTTADGLGVLKVQNSHQFYRTYFPLSAPENINTDAVTVKQITVEDENTLKITFSEPVEIASTVWNSLRVIDDNDSILYVDKGGKLTPNSWEIIDGQKYTYTALQWGGRFTDSGDGQTYYLTITDVKNNLGGLSEIIEYYNNNWKAQGANLAFGIVYNGLNQNGVVEGVVGKDSGRSLISNISYPAFSGVQVYKDGTAITSKNLPPDAFYFVIGAQANALNATQPLTMVAKQEDEHNILVTFGYYNDNGKFIEEKVKLNGENVPYIGLRVVNENNYLVYANRDENGNTVFNRNTSGKPMQWVSESYEMISDTQMRVTFADTINISDIMSKTYLPEDLRDYEIKLCIEESVIKNDNTDENCIPGNGKVWAVVSKDNPIRQLDGNALTSAGTWDGAYASFNALTNNKPVTVKGDAKITGENELTFKWSEAVSGINGGNCYAGIRYVDSASGLVWYYNEEANILTHEATRTDKNGNTVDNIVLQWGGELTYTDDSNTEMVFRIRPATTRFGVYNLADLLNPAADSEWGKVMALAQGELKLCLEEKGANYNAGCIDSFFGADGSMILASPMIGNWNDGIYVNISGKLITGSLAITEVRAVSDTDVIVYFNAPVEVKSAPYAAIRIYDSQDRLLYYNDITKEYTHEAHKTNAKGEKLYTDANGNITTEAKGNTWVSNIPMQWSGSYRYTDEKQTAIRYTLQGREGTPVNNITDIMAYDWDKIGAYYMFAIEENGDDMVVNDGHINNIVRKDNKNIALDGNFFPHDRDNARFKLIKAYTPNKITAYAEVITDTQIRVSFSQPVWVGESFMAIRMLDNNTGKLMWSGEENKSVAFQWSGTWEYEDESQTSIIWTMNGSGIWGANNLYDMLNWKDALEQFKDEGYLRFVIEEKNTEDNPIGYRNDLVECIMSLDGTNHMVANASTGYDSAQFILDEEILSDDAVVVESVTAIDEQSLEVKFNRGVLFKEGDEAVSMAVRYISESGAVEPLFDGRNYAIFNGNWEYADEEKTTVLWKLDSPHAQSLTEILTYSGMFEWNKSARTAFVIVDQNEEYYCPHYSMRINGVTDLDGVHHLTANYINEEVMMLQMDITPGYELPEAEDSSASEKIIQYITNYIPYIIAASVLAVAIIIVAVIAGKKKKNGRTH